MTQLALTLEPGLATRYRDVRECMAARVYHYGLGRVAAELDVAPSNLSAMLAGDRHLPVDLVELFMTKFKDTEPARYLAARFLGDPEMVKAFAMSQLPGLVNVLMNALEASGVDLAQARPKGRR